MAITDTSGLGTPAPRSPSQTTVDVRLDLEWHRAEWEDNAWLRRALKHHIEGVGRELTGGNIRVVSVLVID